MKKNNIYLSWIGSGVHQSRNRVNGRWTQSHLMNTVCNLNFYCLQLTRKCAKWMEICGRKMDWTCSAGDSVVVHVQKGTCFGLSLTLCMIFKICRHFFVNGDFEKFVKILSPQKFQLFEWFFNLMHHAAFKELVESFVKEEFFFRKKNAFLQF